MPETWKPKPPSTVTEYWHRICGMVQNQPFLLTWKHPADTAEYFPPGIDGAATDAMGNARCDLAWVTHADVCDRPRKMVQQGPAGFLLKCGWECFLYGFYPLVERWRINFTFVVLAVALLPLFAPTLLAQHEKGDALICSQQ